MAQPSSYTPQTSFHNDESSNVGGRATVRTTNLDTEFLNIATTLTGVLANLSLNQRDDGAIRDQRVTVAALSTAVIALFASIGVIVRGAWLTATAYAVKDLVTQNTNTYICGTAHTSGTFATDLAAGKWVLMALGLGGGSFGGAALTGITDLTTTGNTTLGDATSDTLNVGALGFVKDAAGNIGFGLAPALFIEALRTQNAQTPLRISNLSGGNAAYAAFLTQADVPGAMWATYGSGHATLASQTWLTTLSVQPIIFGINNVEKARISLNGNFYTADGKIGPNDTQRHVMPAVASDTFALLAAAQTLTNKTVGTTGLVMSNVAQAAATNFDWYEEGTWVPALKIGGLLGTTTYSSQVGKWTRIGNLVFFTGLIQINVYDLSTGGITFGSTSAIPYAAVAGSTYPVTVSMSGVNISSPGWFEPAGHVSAAGAPDVSLRVLTTAGSAGAVAGTNITLANGALFYVSGFYPVT